MSFIFHKQGKVVNIDNLGTLIMNCLNKNTKAEQKQACLEKLQQSVYKDFFEELTELADDKELIRNIGLFNIGKLDDAFRTAKSNFELITPGPYRGMASVTSGNYVKHICDMLQIRGCTSFNDSLKKLGRDTIEGLKPDPQCINVIGNPTQENLCYICGNPLGEMEDYELNQRGEKSRCPSACEHVLNVFQAIKTIIGLYNKQSPTASIRMLERTVYKWSCACCNFTKNQVNFIKNDNFNKWIVDERAIKQTLTFVKAIPSCCKSEYHGKLNIDSRKKDIINLLNTICNTLNNEYSGVISNIQKLSPQYRESIIKSIEFICVLSNISTNGINMVIRRVIRKRTRNDDDDYEEDEKPSKKTKRGGGDDEINNYIKNLNNDEQYFFFVQCIQSLNETIKIQLEYLKTLYHPELFNTIQNLPPSQEGIINEVPLQIAISAKGGKKKTKSKQNKNTRRRTQRRRR